MAAWEYRALSRVPSTNAFFARDCIFCGSTLSLFSDRAGWIAELPPNTSNWRVGDDPSAVGVTSYTVCNLCGWWTLLHVEEMESRRGHVAVHRGAIGALAHIDSVNIDTPLCDVQQYLVAKWDDRNNIDWRLIEDVVGSVFRNVGYHAVVTQRSGDGGIDVILRNHGGQTIGVQVKRQSDRISAEQIRSFVGAILNREHTEGIFVTTSSFTAAAQIEAAVATSRGYPIELVDAESFYEAIGIARLEDPISILPILPNVYETRRLWRIPLR
jgi:restriction system protein